MTRHGGFKQLVRGRARRTGESYSTARANLRRRGAQADIDLVTRYAEPTVRRLRGADVILREAVVPSLSRDQVALLSFWMLFVHWEDGLSGLCRAHPHRMVDRGFWRMMVHGLHDHPPLLAIMARLHPQVQEAAERAPTGTAYEWLEFLDGDEMGRLDHDFRKAMPGSLHRMARLIRSHPDRFGATEAGDR